MTRYKIKRFRSGGYLTTPEPIKPPSQGASALSGAASGAALGSSIMPGWGTAIGAVVGAGAGLIAGGRKKRKYENMMEEYNRKRDAAGILEARDQAILGRDDWQYSGYGYGYKKGGKFKRYKLL